MKALTLKYIGVALCLFVYGLFASPLIRGQGFVYLSNTSQPITGSSLTGSFDIGFTTGTNSSGYLLNSLAVLFAGNDTPVLTSAALDDSGTITSFQDGVEVGAAGSYSFSPSSPLALAANTTYALMVYPVDAQVEINLSYTTSSAFTSTENWNIPGLSGSDEPLFAIMASPIEPAPEPSVASLACVGLFAFIAFQIKRRFANHVSALTWVAHKQIFGASGTVTESSEKK